MRIEPDGQENLTLEQIKTKIQENPLFAAGAVVIVVVVAITLFADVFGSTPTTPADAIQSEENKLKAEQIARRVAEQEAQLAFAKAEQQRLVDMGTRVFQLLDTAEAEMERWDEEVSPLLSSRQGRAIAGEDRLVEGFIEIYYNEERQSRDDISMIRNRVRDYIATSKEHLNQTRLGSVPSEETFRAIERESEQAKTLVGTYQSARERIQALLVGAQQEHPKPAGATLKEAIADLRARVALTDAEAAQNRQERKRQRIRAVEDAKTERLTQAEIEEIEKNAEVEEKLLRQKEEQKRLEMLAMAAKDEFGPLLGKGNTYIDIKHRSWRAANKEGTTFLLSYAWLTGRGVTTNHHHFALALCVPKGDRGPSSKCPHGDTEWNEMQERLGRFNQYYRVYIDNNLLRP